MNNLTTNRDRLLYLMAGTPPAELQLIPELPLNVGLGVLATPPGTAARKRALLAAGVSRAGSEKGGAAS